MKIVKVVGVIVLRTIWIATMIVVPIFGFWLASSLAAFNNASQWLALLVGLLLFPLVPVGWELIYAWRRARNSPDAKPILTRIDRLVLRTLLVNGVFLGIMMWRAPQTSFRALAVRGDWILDGYEGSGVDAVRGAMLGFADHFEKRWHKPDENYGTSDVAPEPTKQELPPVAANDWPVAPEPDVQVTDMPADAQTSIASVAAYLKLRFTDQKRLAKAVHDYIVLRTTYDDDALAKIMARDYEHTPKQDAESVFAARTGVCEGYARLYAAIGKAAGLEVAYITGYIRDAHRRVSETNANGNDASIKTALEGYSHAWNAVKLDGTWQLVDTTWDDPKGAKQPVYSTYLFTPPAYFRFDHLPEDPKWQLIAPLSPGDFVRQPMLTPYAGQLGLTLTAPTRSQVSATDRTVTLTFDNPEHAELVADFVPDGAGDRDGTQCTTSGDTHTTITCSLTPGEFEIRIFGTPRSVTRSRSFSYAYVGSILANAR